LSSLLSNLKTLVAERAHPTHRITARGPLRWAAAAASAQAANDSERDTAAQAEPKLEFDQRIAW